jgi:hypothetical protein
MSRFIRKRHEILAEYNTRMAIANGDNDNTHIQHGDRGGQQRDIPIGAHKMFCLKTRGKKLNGCMERKEFDDKNSRSMV